MEKILHFEGSGPFVLHYEDWDRDGTFGASRELKATNLGDAIIEARAFLAKNQTNPSGLPKQEGSHSISQCHHFNIDDLGIGSKA